MHRTERLFRVEELTRVEGEGSLWVVVEGDQIVDLRFSIFEAPRFYEAFLRGRSFMEVTDITARICGICPVAYQTSSANAMERILGIDVGTGLKDLRRLLYLGEWIESHALHVYLLHAPDFCGYPGGIEMAKDQPGTVRQGLRIKQIGDSVMAAIGGREIHPVTPRIGGFWSVPPVDRLTKLVPDLEWAVEACLDTLTWVSAFDFGDFYADYEFVALTAADEYATIDGRVTSSGGIDVDAAEWELAFEEEQVSWSNALHARVRNGGPYLVGPLARFNLGFEKLHPAAREAAAKANLTPPVRNPFMSIAVRAVEMVHAAASCLDLVKAYTPPTTAFKEGTLRAGEGHGVSEAPRGLLYHRYRIDEEGLITDARIVPPTSQNQLRMEEDLRVLIPRILHLEDAPIQHLLEQAIRNYDPCISCATHFLELKLERR